MSKFEKVKVSLFAFITTLSIISIFSCEIGLGAAVDTEAPNINITVPNPETVAVIRDSFPIMGTWTDDGSIDSIKVVISSNASNKKYEKYADVTPPAKEGEKGTWSVFIEPGADGILDGAYSVNITITDTVGHSSDTSSQIRIDNTPPLIVLQRPSTILTDTSSDPDAYGKTFSLIGQSTDENGVNLMKLKFYHNSDLSDTPTEIELSKVPDTINYDIARFELNTQNAYSDIYNSTTLAGTKDAYFKLVAYDGAQKYERNGTQTAADTFGNPATVYYLYDNIADLITSYKVTGLYKILAGTYDLSEAGRSAGQSSGVLNQLKQKQVAAGKFSLNPANTPTYTLSGGDRLELPSPNISECADFFASGNHDNIVLSLGSSIQLNVMPGLDGVSLRENTLIPYAIEYPEPAGGENKLAIEVSSRKQSSTSDGTTIYKIEGLINESSGFETNKCYRIVLEGEDKDGIGVEPEGNGYGFYCRKVGDGPKLEITSPEDININKKAGESVTISGNVEYTENGLLEILLNKMGGEPETVFSYDTTSGSAAGITQHTDITTKYDFTYTIPASKFTQNSSDKYKIEVQATGDEITVSKTRSVVYDVANPEATIFEPEPVAHKYSDSGVQQSGNYLNKTIKIKANVKDTGGSDVDLENTHLQYSTNGTSDWKEYTAAEILKGTNTYSVDTTDTTKLTGLTNGNVYFRVNVKDNSGNEGNSDVIGPYIVDQTTDAPVILPGKDWMEFYATSNADFSDNFTRNLLQVKKVYFRLIDDDDNGLQSVKVDVFQSNGTKVTDSTVTAVKDFSAGKKECICYFETKNLNEGKYRVVVTATSENEASSSKETWISITAAAPRLSNISIDNKYVTTNNITIASGQPFAEPKKKIKASFKINSTSAPFKLTYKITAVDTADTTAAETLIKGFDDVNGATTLTETANYDSTNLIWSYEITPETSWTSGNKKAFKLQLKVYDKNHNEGLQNTPIDFYIDNSLPGVTAVATPDTAETEGNSWDFDISASDTDGDSAYPAKYFIAFANKSDTGAVSDRTDWLDATSLKSYPLTYTNLPAVFGTADAPNSGKKVVYVKVQDSVGNISDEFSKEFDYDKGDPTAAITGYTIGSTSTTITENEFFAKALFTLSASAEDDWEIESLELTETKDGNTTAPIAVKLVSGVLKKADDSALNLPSTGLGTGEFKYTLTATDKAGKTGTSAEISVQIDQTAPALTLNAISTAPLNGLVAFSGSASDEGLGLKSLLHKIVAEGSVAPADNSLNASELSGNSTNWRLSVETIAGKPATGTNAITWDASAAKYKLYEGKYKLYARANDKADNVSDNAHSIGYAATPASSFIVDYAKPEVDSAKLIVGSDEAAITGSGLNYFKVDSGSTVKVHFIVKETNGLDEVKINNDTQTITAPDADGNYTFEYTIPAASYTGTNANKAIDIKVDLKDIAGRENSVTYKIYNDTEKPEISIDNPGTDVSGTSSIAGSSFIFSATVKDKANGSGLKDGKFNYIFTKSTLADDAIKTNATEIAIPGSTGNWTVTKQLGTGTSGTDTSKLYEGKYHLYIYAEDAKGNGETAGRLFWIDQAAPVISDLTSLNEIYNEGFVLSGKASDANGIASITVKDDTVTIPAAAVTITTAENGEKTFTIDFITGDTAAQAGKYKLVDGAHELTIIAEDGAGKTTEEKLSVTVDTTKPTITSMEIATADAEIGSSPVQKWYKSEYVGVTVTGVSDGTGTGIKKVEVSSDGSSWTELSSPVDGTYTGSAYCSTQGGNTISLKITDNAGNVNDTNSKLVYIDTAEPVLPEITEVKVGNTVKSLTDLTDILVNGADPVTLKVKAVDENVSENPDEPTCSGIAQVSLTKPVENAISTTTGDSSDIYTITIPETALKSGAIVLKATDKVGKEKTYTSNIKITLDNQKPEVKKINAPAAVNGKLALSGTVYDNRSAFKSVDVFYYVDSDETGYKKWVSCYHDELTASSEHKPSANWELDPRLDTTAFTKAGVTDGTTIYILTVVYDEAGNCNIALDATGLPSMTPAQITASTDTKVKASIKELTLNQDGDRPEITLNGLTISSMSSGNLVKISESSVSGRITDDDGVAKLYYSKGGTGDNDWIEISLAQDGSTNTTFTWANPAEGTYGKNGNPTLKFKVVDTEGGEFITMADTAAITGTPKIANGPAGLSSSGLYFIIDRTAPAVRDIKIKTSASAEYITDITGAAIGGDTDHNKFWLQLYAYDVNGILDNGVTATLASATNDPANSEYTKTFTKGAAEADEYVLYTMDTPFDVTDWVSGTRTLSIKVDDGTKANEKNSFTIKIDNDAPTVQVTNHQTDELLSTDFTLKGDIRGSDDGTKLWYAVTKSEEEPAAWTATNNTAGEVVGIGTGKWAISFDDGTTDATSTHSLSPKELVLTLTTSPALTKNSNGAIVYASGAQEGEPYTTAENYYVHFKVTDKYGNTSKSYYQCRIDPQGDIPTITRTETDDEVNGWVKTSDGSWYADASDTNKWGYPKTDDAGNENPAPSDDYGIFYPAALMSGVARISGTASALNGVKAIYMQVDPSFNPSTGFAANWDTKELPNYEGTIAAKYTELGYSYENIGNSNKKGIKIGSSQTWSYAFNKHSEFENDGAEYNVIAIRLYAVDKNNNVSLTPDDDLFVIRLDSGAPKIGSSEPLVLRQYSNNAAATGTVTKEIRYEKNMWLKGEWWLCGSVEDPSGIKDLIIAGEDLVKDQTINDDLTNGSAVAKNYGSSSGYSFKYKVGSNDQGSSSTLSYEIKVLDTDSTAATEPVSIKYDNKAPELIKEGNNYSIPNDVKNDHGFYTLQASAREDKGESGFLRTVFYFKRTLDGHKNVYDSYIKKSNAVNALSYEGTTPVVTEGEEHLFWKAITISSISGSNVNISAADVNIHKGGLAKLKGAYYRIDNVSGTEVTLDETLDDLTINTSSDLLYVAIGHVVDHEGSETPGNSSDIEKTAEVLYGYYKNLASDNDDGDCMIESVSTENTETVWSGTINSNNIPDGDIEIHYVVFDAAGNSAHGVVKSDATTKVRVGNNAPRLAGLTVKSGSMSQTYYNAAQPRFVNGEYILRATALTDATNNTLVVSGDGKDEKNNGTAFMMVKDTIQFIPELIGGNGALTYEYYVNHPKTVEGQIQTVRIPATGTTSSPANWTGHGFDDGIDEDEDDSGYLQKSAGETFIQTHTETENAANTIEFTNMAALGTNSITGNPTWFNYTIKDSTAGESLDVSFSCALDVQYFDGTAPKISIADLGWESETKNSLYKNSLENGHIELKKDLTADLQSSPYGGDRDKVSGKITMRGEASDNIQVNELWAKIDGFTFTGAETDANEFAKIASYNGSTGWTSVSEYQEESETNMNAKGWTFRVTENIDDETQHKIKWELSWDTEKITDVAATAVKFQIFAKDALRGGTANSSSTNTYTVDVVPYITDVETSLSSIQSTNPSVYSRTALGHYPVYYVTKEKDATTGRGEKITYKGFNLGNATYTVTEASASGEYDFTVNEIKSINNKNDNTKDYNKRPNKENNDKLTDDVFLDVWQFNSQAAVPIEGKIEQAVMKINPVNDQIGFAFVNGSFWTSMADKDNSYRTWMTSRDFCSSTSFTYDKDGNSYGVMAGGDSGDMADKYNFVTSRWNVSGAADAASSSYSSRDGSNALRIEELCDNTYSNAAFAKQRFVSSSLAVSTHDEYTNVYLAYFDSLYNQIRFRAGTMYVCPIDYYDNGNNGYTYGHVTLPANQTAFTNNIQITFCDETGKELTAEEYANIGWGDRAKYFVSKANHNNNSTDWWFTLAKEVNGQNLEDRRNNDRKQFWNGEYTLRNNNNGTRIPTQRLYIKFNAASKSNFGNFVDACTARDGWGSYADARKYAQVLASGETPVAENVDDIPDAKAGSSVSIGVTEDNNGNDVVVAVWYDEVNYKMWYAYNTSPTTDRGNGSRNDANTDDGWSTPIEVFTGDMEKAGSYCKVAVDASGGVHIAAFDMANNNVVYAYATSYNSSFTTCLVDGNIPSGEYLTLDVALDTSGNAVPYIGYYSQGCVRPKMAYAVNASTNAGTDANGYMTGDWEITVVPTPKQVETQSNQHNPINIGVWKNESGVIKASSSTASSLTGTKASDMSGKIYGNGTSNPVLGYVITDDTIETAQKK